MRRHNSRNNSAILYQCNTYRYDDKGHFISNYSALGKNTLLPMKYRDLKSKILVAPRPQTRSPSRNIKHDIDNYYKSKLSININKREIYVLRDGSSVVIGEKLPGFYYTFELSNNLERFKHTQEVAEFFQICQQQFKTHTPFKFLFSNAGKLLHCLHELSAESKIVIVGHVNEFQGIIEQNKSEVIRPISRSPCYRTHKSEKSSDLNIIDNIESQFKVQSCKYKSSKISCRKSLTKSIKFKDEHLHDSHILKLQRLKESLGCVSYKIDKTFTTLLNQGLQRLKNTYKFTEAQLHNLYGKYKLLVLLSCGLDPNHKISKGISRETFIEYYSKSKELTFVLGRIFDKIDIDKGGTVSWEEYLQAMDIIWHGDHSSQLELFFSVYDLDNNGLLSFKEIQELCKLQLQIEKDDDLIEELSFSFASLIFDLTNTDYSDEIHPSKIQQIIKSQEDNSLIEMFCSFNCLK